MTEITCACFLAAMRSRTLLSLLCSVLCTTIQKSPLNNNAAGIFRQTNTPRARRRCTQHQPCESAFRRPHRGELALCANPITQRAQSKEPKHKTEPRLSISKIQIGTDMHVHRVSARDFAAYELLDQHHLLVVARDLTTQHEQRTANGKSKHHTTTHKRNGRIQRTRSMPVWGSANRRRT